MGALARLSGLRRIFADPDLAVDLGTANTRLYAVGRGLIADEPTVVSISPQTGSIEAVGARAARMASHDETTLRPVSPLRAGVVKDIDAAASLLSPLFRRARRFGLMKPRVLACAPTDACDDERAALVEAARRAGASAVTIAPEPLAAAIGAGLDVSSPYAQMLVDVGDGVTDIAIIASSTVIFSSAVRTACSDLHAAVQSHIADRHGTMLYFHEAERLTRRVGLVGRTAPEQSISAKGEHCTTGRETKVVVTNREVSDALAPGVDTILGAIRRTLQEIPHTTACEVIENGLCLTGGGARLPGFAGFLAAETQLDVNPAADPLRAVIDGARQMIAVGRLTGIWAS